MAALSYTEIVIGHAPQLLRRSELLTVAILQACTGEKLWKTLYSRYIIVNQSVGGKCAYILKQQKML